jgi:hypothetical protein
VPLHVRQRRLEPVAHDVLGREVGIVLDAGVHVAVGLDVDNHLVECRDLEEALSIAGQIPTLPAGGAIEVRPLIHAFQR